MTYRRNHDRQRKADTPAGIIRNAPGRRRPNRLPRTARLCDFERRQARLQPLCMHFRIRPRWQILRTLLSRMIEPYCICGDTNGASPRACAVQVTEENKFEQWAVVELMGRVRMAGKVTEETHFGTALGRIDIPTGDGFSTQYFSGASVYRVSPCTEELARSVAAHNQPEPVHSWELPAKPVAMIEQDYDNEGILEEEDFDEN